jgi:hypothetical protein
VDEAAGALLAACFTLVSCLSYYSTMKVEATYSSEMSVNFERTTRRYIPEDKANFKMFHVLHLRTTLPNRKQVQKKFMRRINSGKACYHHHHRHCHEVCRLRLVRFIALELKMVLV